MGIRQAASGLALLILAAGCCKSVQPLYTPETIKHDLDIAGTWETYDPNQKRFDAQRPITIKSLGDGEFEASWSEKNTWDRNPTVEKHAVRLCAVELEGTLYLDVKSTDPIEGTMTKLIAGHHLIFCAHLTGDRLFLADLDPKKVQVCAAEEKLPVASSGWGGAILDVPTADLQKFLARHRDEVFGPLTRLRRIARPQFD